MASQAEIHTLAAPYAVHALPDDEIELFEEHLAECEACRVEVDELRETAARLGTATAVVPPAEMKDEVLRRIREIRRLPPVDDSAGPDRQPESAARRKAMQRWWPRVATGLVAAMTAGVIVLGAQLNDARQELESTQQELEEVLQAGGDMRELVAAPDMEMIRAEVGESSGTVVMARSLDTAVLVVDGMDPAPHEHTYQLWLIGDDDVRSAGVLGDTDDGRIGPFIAHGLDDAARLGITVEPVGGSEEPTTEPLMLIDLPA